jgi:hypothetical protein
MNIMQYAVQDFRSAGQREYAESPGKVKTFLDKK